MNYKDEITKIFCEVDDFCKEFSSTIAELNRAIERAIKAASFRCNASLEEIDYSFERGLDQNQVERLATLAFIKENKDLFITGPTGRL